MSVCHRIPIAQCCSACCGNRFFFGSLDRWNGGGGRGGGGGVGGVLVLERGRVVALLGHVSNSDCV